MRSKMGREDQAQVEKTRSSRLKHPPARIRARDLFAGWLRHTLGVRESLGRYRLSSCSSHSPTGLHCTPRPPTASMASDNPGSKPHRGARRPLRDALEPVTSVLASHGNTLSAVKEAIMAPFHSDGFRPESMKMISDRKYVSARCAPIADRLVECSCAAYYES
jgi:hypothetical protein